MVERYASDVTNTTTYDRTVLSEITAHHMSALDDKSTVDFRIGLLDSRPAPAKLKTFLMAQCGLDEVPPQFCRTALAARHSECSICHKGDVVIVKSDRGTAFDVGMVWAHAEIFGEALSLVSVWERVSSDRQTATAEYREVTQDEVLPCLIYWLRSSIADLGQGLHVCLCRPGSDRSCEILASLRTKIICGTEALRDPDMFPSPVFQTWFPAQPHP